MDNRQASKIVYFVSLHSCRLKANRHANSVYNHDERLMWRQFAACILYVSVHCPELRLHNQSRRAGNFESDVTERNLVDAVQELSTLNPLTVDEGP